MHLDLHLLDREHLHGGTLPFYIYISKGVSEATDFGRLWTEQL